MQLGLASSLIEVRLIYVGDRSYVMLLIIHRDYCPEIWEELTSGGVEYSRHFKLSECEDDSLPIEAQVVEKSIGAVMKIIIAWRESKPTRRCEIILADGSEFKFENYSAKEIVSIYEKITSIRIDKKGNS